jgi:flagellar assembly protein FliH
VVEKTRIPAAHSGEFVSWALPDVEAGSMGDVAQSGREPLDRAAARGLTAGQLEEITAQAQREGFDEGIKEGHATGFAQGQEEGLAQGLAQGMAQGVAESRAIAAAELATQVAELRSVMQQLLEPLAQQNAAIETAMTQLSLDIARAVLHCEPALPPEKLLPLVRRAVRELPVGERNLTVVLNPQQLELVRGHAEWPSNWHLQGDSRLDRGGCKVITEHSLVDYSVELRFRQIAAQMLAESADDELVEPGLLLDADDD